MIRTFPDFPFVNQHGITFTTKDIDTIYKYARAAVKGLRKNPDDYNLEIANAILSVIKNFDPANKASLRTYTSFCVRNKVFTAMSRAVDSFNEISLDDVRNISDKLLTEDNINLYVDMKEINKAVGSLARRYISLKAEGVSDVEVAKKLNISERKVREIKQFIKIKMMEI